MKPFCSTFLSLLCLTFTPAMLCHRAYADEMVSDEITIVSDILTEPLTTEPLTQERSSESVPAEAIDELPATTQTLTEIPATAVPTGGFLLNPGLLNGERISEVRIYLENPTPDPDRNQKLQEQIAQAFAVRSGDNYNRLFLNAGLQRVEQLAFVKAAQNAFYEVQIPGEVVVVLSVRLKAEAVTKPRETGILVTGDLREFPNLYTNDRATAVAILRGGLSNFSSSNTWFGNAALFTQGNPLARDPARAGTYSWLDSYLEFGVAGITQIDTLPLYVYGSATNIVSTTLQPDLFESNNRIFSGIEDLYGGVLYGYRTDNSRFGINLSAGRQDYRISNGMLFANGAGNGGDRATILSNPRTAFENTVIGRIRWNDLRLEGFYLDPNELPLIDSRTKFVGANLEYDNNRSVQLGLSYIHVPESDSSYFTSTSVFPKKGLNVIYPRVRFSNLFGLDGLWLQAEYAHQWNDSFDMAANAAWGQIGYTIQDLPWTPTLSYRYAYFSGDNPNTSTFERFDPLLSGGSPDTWIQGANLVKLYQNSNLITHQVVLRLRPSQQFDLSLQYIHLSAAELNNLGGAQALSFLESSEIGQELTLTGRYNLSRNFLLYASGSVAFPGAAIQKVVGNNPGPWYFLQLSLLMNF
ncbi:alginate export family protein [Pseudanabaena sp. PCC 6802]|uniref:alginate export family protein n=1 Tax=Pseudanabaena sp. PCC 6802 TaxID=118173 RepID=UPI000345E693|nr:alginate export family protein [Pseudanabaena sp. PCC 6802]